MVIPLSVGRFNRRVTNRIIGPFADRLPGFAILIHTGRRSGRTYRTPISAFRDGDDYLFVLTYGPKTEWVRNIFAAGGCAIVTRGQSIALTNPRFFTDTRKRWAPLPVRVFLRLTGISRCLRLTRVPTPNTFDAPHTPAEPPRALR